MRVVDEISTHLPLKDLSTGGKYGVIVGLQVSQRQLDLNRGKPSSPTPSPAAPSSTPPASGLLIPAPQVPAR